MSTTSLSSMIMSFEAYLTSKLASKNVGFQLLNYPLCLSIEENNVLCAGNGGSVIPRSKGMVKGCLPPKFPVWARKTK